MAPELRGCCCGYPGAGWQGSRKGNSLPRGSRCVANDRFAEVQLDSQTPARVLAERVGRSESAVLRRGDDDFKRQEDLT